MPVVEAAPALPATIRERNDNAPLALKGSGGPGKGKRPKKPPTIYGYEWSQQSTGWTLRRVIVENGKRRREYVGYLSGPAWATMQRDNPGAALKGAVREWIESKEGKRTQGLLLELNTCDLDV